MLCKGVKRQGLTRQSICRIVLYCSEVEAPAFNMRIELIYPLYGWLRRVVTGEIPLEESILFMQVT